MNPRALFDRLITFRKERPDKHDLRSRWRHSIDLIACKTGLESHLAAMGADGLWPRAAMSGARVVIWPARVTAAPLLTAVAVGGWAHVGDVCDSSRRSDSEDCVRHPQYEMGEAYLGRSMERRRSRHACPTRCGPQSASRDSLDSPAKTIVLGPTRKRVLRAALLFG